MDRRLGDAARLGDVIALHRILEDDPQTLEKACLAPFSESPLHASAHAGKADFVKETIALMPSLATHTNKQGLIPLHRASAAGHVEAVKELLKAKIEVNQCLLKDNDGLIPLHHAVFNGKIGVIEELISHCPNSVGQVTAEGESVLRLAVKANQFEALDMLKEKLQRLQNFRDLVRTKDRDGKTVHELEAVKNPSQERQIVQEDDHKIDVTKVEHKASQKSSAAKEEHHSQETVLLVATIILTLTYQGLLSPPSTIFKYGQDINWGCLRIRYRDGVKHLTTCPAFFTVSFLIFNTAVFCQSIFIIVRNLPDHGTLLLRFLTLTLQLIYCILLLASSYDFIYIAAPLYGLFLAFMIHQTWYKFLPRVQKSIKSIMRG